jgi:hypothetical protein
MADDNKRNALFSKLLSKEKPKTEPEVKDETASLDELMAFDPEVSETHEAEANTPAADEVSLEEWFADNMDDNSGVADVDITDAIAELFGDDVTQASDIGLQIEELDETPDIAEVGYEEPASEQEYVEEPVYEEIVEENSEDLEYEDDETEEEPSAEPEEPAVDEDTATLLAALGYSDAQSQQPVKQVSRPEKIQRKTVDLSLAYGYDGEEYMSRAQTSAIKNTYARNRFNMLIRLGATALFAILLFVYDTFGQGFGGALDAKVYPVVNIMISLQLLLIAAAFSFKQIIAGINGIFKAEPIVHSVSATALVITVLYDVVIAIVSPEAFTLYNFPAAICLLLSVLHDYFVLERETYVFDRLSSWQSIATLEKVDSADLAAELGEGHVGDAENKIGQAFRMRRGEFAENYFRHINRRHPLTKILNFIIAPVIALSLVIFIISLASDKTALEAFNVMLTVNLFALPSFMLVSMSYPFYTLVSKNLNADSVIFSESDVSEYKKVDTVVFEESDLFDESSLTINRISVCDKNRMQDVFDIMCGVSALYDRVGGRIAGAFRASTSEGDIPTDVSIISVDDGGFEGRAGGRLYTVGSDAYLTSKGISVMRYYDDKYIASNPGGVVLHIAVEGVEVFKLYLTYRISDSMLSVINELAFAKTRIIMRTVDPNINLDLILRMLTSTFDGNLSLVRKPYDEQAEVTLQKEESAIEGGVLVNGENTEAILDVVKACKLYGSFSKLSFNTSIILFGAGALLSVFLGIIGALAGISSLYVVLFQIISVIPSIILSNLILK